MGDRNRDRGLIFEMRVDRPGAVEIMLELCGYPSPTGPALAIMPPPIVKPEFLVQGIPASRGIAYGPAFIYLKSDVEVPSYLIAAEKRGEEAT